MGHLADGVSAHAHGLPPDAERGPEAGSHRDIEDSWSGASRTQASLGHGPGVRVRLEDHSSLKATFETGSKEKTIETRQVGEVGNPPPPFVEESRQRDAHGQGRGRTVGRHKYGAPDS